MNLSGAAVDALTASAALAAAGAVGFLVLRRDPRVAFAAWIATMCLVPIWSGTTVVFYFQPQVLMTVAVLAALMPVRRGPGSRVTLPDALLVVFVVAGLAPLLLGSSTLSSVFVLVTQWTGAFLLGRVVVRRVSLGRVQQTIAIGFTVVAVLALLEAATGWNPFSSFPGANGLRTNWVGIQVRGGLSRAEGAFGHSIALGGSLAMAVPLTLTAPFRPAFRATAVMLMTAAVTVTFSRTGLVTVVVGIITAVCFLPSGLSTRLKVAITTALAVGAAVTAPAISSVFTAAGDEASGSAAYRGQLWDLLGDMRLLGLSSSFYRSPSGEAYFGAFRSIDNALVLLGLTYGILALGCVVLGLVLAVGAVVSRRGNAATVALVAQIPAFATVALITQYATWVWFVAGLAVAAGAVVDRPVVPAGTSTPGVPQEGGHRGQVGSRGVPAS